MSAVSIFLPHLILEKCIMNNFITFTLDIKDSLEKKRSVFINKAIPNHPPVFRNWYLKEFPSPGEWLTILLKSVINL